MADHPRDTHVLLVEDDDVDAEAVRRAFKKAGITNPVRLVRDGVEALEALEANGPSLPLPCLVLLDINMPRMNGLQLLEAMRGRDKLKNNIVFMLTTSAREEDLSVAYGLGAAGYVLKENLEDLAGMLSQYCRINEMPSGA